MEGHITPATNVFEVFTTAINAVQVIALAYIAVLQYKAVKSSERVEREVRNHTSLE